MKRTLLLAAMILAAPNSFALEQPVVWRDDDTGCAYLLTPQGGISPRYKRDGALDCPGAQASQPGPSFMDQAARDLARGLDALRREVERLRDRYNDQRP